MLYNGRVSSLLCSCARLVTQAEVGYYSATLPPDILLLHTTHPVSNHCYILVGRGGESKRTVCFLHKSLYSLIGDACQMPKTYKTHSICNTDSSIVVVDDNNELDKWMNDVIMMMIRYTKWMIHNNQFEATYHIDTYLRSNYDVMWHVTVIVSRHCDCVTAWQWGGDLPFNPSVATTTNRPEWITHSHPPTHLPGWPTTALSNDQ